MLHPDLVQNFTDQYILSDANILILRTAIEAADDHVGTEHILWGLLTNATIPAVLNQLRFREYSLNADTLKANLSAYFYTDKNAPPVNADGLTTTAVQTYQIAAQERAKRGSEKTEPIHLLVGMLDSTVGGAYLLIAETLLGQGNLPFDSENQHKIKTFIASEIREIAYRE
jgi:hypothetical protein